jgi:AcrR family transcriptional regulator
MARRNDHTREELHGMALDAASFIIGAQGLAALSARKVAARMGYSVGTVYLLFHDLDDLIGQANTRTLAEMYTRLHAAAAAAPAAPGRVYAVTRAYTDFALLNSGRWSALYEHALQARHQPPANLAHEISKLYTLLEDLLQALAPQRPARETAQAARALWGGVQGVCLLALSDRLDIERIESLPAISDSLVEHFLTGYCA